MRIYRCKDCFTCVFIFIDCKIYFRCDFIDIFLKKHFWWTYGKNSKSAGTLIKCRLRLRQRILGSYYHTWGTFSSGEIIRGGGGGGGGGERRMIPWHERSSSSNKVKEVDEEKEGRVTSSSLLLFLLLSSLLRSCAIHIHSGRAGKDRSKEEKEGKQGWANT